MIIAAKRLEIDFATITLTLQGDNSFYSQRGSDFFPNRLDQQPAHSIPLNPSLKTGIGSSAAMAVSFLAALLEACAYKVIGEDGLPTRDFHALCQVLNAFIQDKVGSGFDIAASIYGSQVYRRFTNVDQLSKFLIPQM